MVTYNLKYISMAVALTLASLSSVEANNDPFSSDLESTNLVGPKSFKRFKYPKSDWTQKEPKDSSVLSSKTLSSPKIINLLLTPQK